jgi:hypothetical protein
MLALKKEVSTSNSAIMSELWRPHPLILHSSTNPIYKKNAAIFNISLFKAPPRTQSRQDRNVDGTEKGNTVIQM